MVRRDPYCWRTEPGVPKKRPLLSWSIDWTPDLEKWPRHCLLRIWPFYAVFIYKHDDLYFWVTSVGYRLRNQVKSILRSHLFIKCVIRKYTILLKGAFKQNSLVTRPRNLEGGIRSLCDHYVTLGVAAILVVIHGGGVIVPMDLAWSFRTICTIVVATPRDNLNAHVI